MIGAKFELFKNEVHCHTHVPLCEMSEHSGDYSRITYQNISYQKLFTVCEKPRNKVRAIKTCIEYSQEKTQIGP